MKIRQLFVVALVFGLLSGITLGQDKPNPPKTPRIAKRQIHQQARIQQGVKSGELTKGETRKLEREQAKVQHEKKEAKSDGKLTPQERRHITREQNKVNREINRLKHNDRKQK
jgi:hypothetical protein